MTRFPMACFAPALAAGICIAASVIALPAPAQAAIEYPWCAQYSGDENGGRNCGFVSYEQCMETARGAGAFCERNLFYNAPQTKPKPVHKRTAPR